MSSIKNFIKDWMLPIAIVIGMTSCLALQFIHPLKESIEPGFSSFAKNIQPFLVALMLFLQFNKVSPHDLKLRKWHLILLLFQSIIFIGLAFLSTLVPAGNLRILMECVILCLVCPTAAAAGVITEKLGGSLSDTISYVVIINLVDAIIIPMMIPIIHPATGTTFIDGFLAICSRVFPMLVLPLLLAWTIRYTMKKLQRRLMRYTHWAFNIWGMTLTLAIYLATRALLTSGIAIWVAILICVISLLCCLIQFVVGRAAGNIHGKTSEKITAGQALGQKNTGFLIWLGYSYMTPVTSVSGGMYSIWQNIFNSWELYMKRHEVEKKED